jgi:hypothetical protein
MIFSFFKEKKLKAPIKKTQITLNYNFKKTEKGKITQKALKSANLRFFK